MDPTTHRHHRLRQHQRRLSHGARARSQLIRVKACADLRPEAAEAQAKAYGVAAVPVDALLADPEIEIVINLTVPLAHGPSQPADHHRRQARLFGEAARRALQRGPGADARRRRPRPARRLRARHLPRRGHQACRRAIDAGRIGRPIAGAAAVLSHGMEHWHPNPDFFFKRGGGPILDIGRYYVTQLVNLLGPVARGRRPGLDRQPDPHRDQRAARAAR